MSALRSLHSADLICIVESDEILSATFVSHLTKGRIKTTKRNRWEKISNFLENEFQKSKGKKTILIPMEDVTMKWVIENQRYLKQYADFLVPSLETYLIADDKLTLMEFAESLNIPHPRSYKFSIDFFENSFLKEDERDLEWDLQWVVKPRISSGSRGVVYIEGSSYLKHDFALQESTFGELLIQQRLPRSGTTIGVWLGFFAMVDKFTSFARIVADPMGVPVVTTGAVPIIQINNAIGRITNEYELTQFMIFLNRMDRRELKQVFMSKAVNAKHLATIVGQNREFLEYTSSRETGAMI